MKSIFFFLIILLTFSNIFAQEIYPNKAKIGKYSYEIYLKGFYNYEIDEYGINYCIRLNGKERIIGPFLTYRTFLKSRMAPIVDENLPPNPLLKFSDREVTGGGKIEIKKSKREIVNTFIKYTKNYESEPDSVKSVYKQTKNGLFNIVLISEYHNGKEKTVFKK